MKLKELLKDKLTKEEIAIAPSSFDVVGNIMIFSEFPRELIKKERIIGSLISRKYHNILSVYKKTKNYSGKYRTPRLKLIAGEKIKETIHKENNIRIKLNVEKVYFSARLSSERKRIFQQIKKNETILVMFSGIGVYPLTIAKNSNAKEIVGIEINPTAHKYALENLRLNKLEGRIKLYKGDVREAVFEIKKKFDRIVMPLPKGAESFLDAALKRIRSNGIIHFYTFSEENNYELIKSMIKEECKKQKRTCRILRIVKCGQFSPGVFRVCVDFRARC